MDARNLTLARSPTRAAGNPARTAATEAEPVPRLVQLAAQELDARELAFAEHFAQHNNATEAFRHAYKCDGWKRASITQEGWRVSNRPHVVRYVRELMSAAAALAVVDVAALLARDRAIVEAYDLHADEVTQHILECCRHCHGEGHEYQWVDDMEFYAALEAADLVNEERIASKKRPLPLPSDVGGYGFSPSNEPNHKCPKCEGRGVPRVFFADTTKLTGGARRLVKGVKQGANGQLEILMHDVDKAAERLYKAAGAFGDDAASVARGAAQGAAIGAATAQAIAAKVDNMSVEDARKAYLALANIR
jgi:phage terminase small subunit